MAIERLRDKINWAVRQPHARRRDGRSGPVNQALLGVEIFGKDGPAFNRFLSKGVLTSEQLTELSAWLGCSEHALATYPFDQFIENPQGQPIQWKDIVAAGKRDGELQSDEDRSKLFAMAARPRGVPLRSRNARPIFLPNTCLRLVVPTTIGGMNASGWSVFVFGFDKEGFDNLLPRCAEEFGYRSEVPVLDNDAFIFPNAQGSLEIAPEAHGVCGFILLMSADMIPDSLSAAISCPQEPEQLAPHLDRLASWLGGRDPERYRVFRLEYEVR